MRPAGFSGQTTVASDLPRTRPYPETFCERRESMSAARQFPAKDRSGKQAWLGPISLWLGLLSWVIPVVGSLVAVSAVACGAVSMTTRAQYRIDWTAAVGTGAGVGRVGLSLFVLAMTTSGY